MLLILYSCFPGAVLSQVSAYSPEPLNEKMLTTLAAKYEEHYKQELTLLPKENKADYEKAYKERWENIKEIFDKKEIYTSPSAQQYLDALVADIVKANPQLVNEKFNCYFSRSGIPNASYIGEGIILVNMGLFKKLDNESQLVFILSHEISHFYLRHNENNIKRYVTTLNSDEVQNELKAIKRNEYGKRQLVEKLSKNITFDMRRHGRDHESEADSMAIEFMRHTKFDIAQSLTTLALLDSIDNDTFNTAKALEKLFSSPEFPFQKKWLKKEEGLLGGHAKLKKDTTLADSLKTHPDCKVRIKYLEPMVDKYHSKVSVLNAVNKAKMDEVINAFDYEIIAFAFDTDKYTRSLYNTIQLLQSRPGDPFLITKTGNIFNGFYAAQKAHNLSKVIDIPAPYYPANYNTLLQFVQNLYADEFLGISYNFLKQYYEKLNTYPPFIKAFNTSKKNNSIISY